MAVWSEVNLCACRDANRLDAEHYQPHYLTYADAVSQGQSLRSITSIIHPTEITRVYESDGIQILLAQNIRHNYLDFSATVYMPNSAKQPLARNRLEYDDVVMTRSGANFGDAAAYKGKPTEIYACADCLILRPRGVLGGYLATYLNTSIGRALLTRGAYGMAQPHIAPNYLYTMHLPRLGEAVERQVDELVLTGYALQERSETLYAQAEAMLAKELGLDAIDLSHQLAYERDFREVQEAGRLDAEYWGPKYVHNAELLKSMPHDSLGRIASFSNGATPLGADYPSNGIPFLRIQNVCKNYLELDDVVHISQQIHEGHLKRSQLEPGDVLITITGRIGTAAVVPDDLPKANMNQHSVRLRVRDASINPYYLSAFLNSRAGLRQTERESYGSTRDALPYYCLKRVIIPRASRQLQDSIEASVRKADEARKEAKLVLDDAKRRVEELIENTPR